jgi:glycogen debranching enzyme
MEHGLMSNEQITAAPPRSPSGTTGDGKDKSPFYILASSAQADEQTRVLKDDDTFAVFDHYGDVKPVGMGEEGLYHEGTRFLSCWMLGLNRERPLFLSSTVKEDNDLLTVDLTNLDLTRAGRVIVPRGTLHISRTRFLWRNTCHERLRVRNYGLAPVAVHFSFHFEADFADIFEVRGTRRLRKGTFLTPSVGERTVVLSYEGLDRVVRRTHLQFSSRPATLSESGALFELSLGPQEETALDVAIACEREGARSEVLSYHDAQAAAAGHQAQTRESCGTVQTANEQFNVLLRRSTADLHMMTSETEAGPYPYAGVPWFSTPFGRDGILTALECLWLYPDLARGVLAYLAATQASEVVPEQDAEPGKILHETRRGEMAALGEIPFGRYYGSIDSTPLFVLLAAAYYQRSGDRDFVAQLWPNVERALAWMHTYGDRDGDGFIEYQRRSPQGLVQQGWKDSNDSVFHADGTLADAPIALCEVQAYAYGALQGAARLAAVLGHSQQADALQAQADRLRQRFEEAFWCPDLGTYALALDGAKRPCKVRTSNAGHCLLTGIARPEHAREVAGALMDHDGYSGWGVRTLAASEARYNPMSYHNGSVWPHDNALVAEGLAHYGCKDAVLRILAGLFDASLYLDLHRLPELFCGFPRRHGEGPTLYPVACAPQAWSAASVFMLLQACLGITIRGPEAQVYFAYPQLPEFLPEVQVRNLRVGSATLDLLLIRHGHDVGINVLRRDGDAHILMVK